MEILVKRHEKVKYVFLSVINVVILFLDCFRYHSLQCVQRALATQLSEYYQFNCVFTSVLTQYVNCIYILLQIYIFGQQIHISSLAALLTCPNKLSMYVCTNVRTDARTTICTYVRTPVRTYILNTCTYGRTYVLL